MIYGTAYDDSLGDQLRVTVVATGLSPARRAQTPISVVHTAPLQRTGTDNMPVLSQPAAATTAAGVTGSRTTTATCRRPSVWRNSRSAAAKVDALASNGMDEIEIPAFLRKQAD